MPRHAATPGRRPPRGAVPAAARAPAARGPDAPADPRRVRRPGPPRRRARAAPPEHRPRPPRARSSCGARRGPARPASPGSWPARSAPTSRRSPRSWPASPTSARTIAEAQDRLALHGTRTVLFLDEIHRFNKAQQDALLPHVEDGTVTLIGATTENPYFEVNSALLSRMRVWRLEPLTDDDVATVVRRALDDEERGLAGPLGPDGGVALDDDAFEHLVGARRRRRAGGAQRPRGRHRPGRGRGHPRRGRPRHARGSRTSRPPPSSASSPTTGPATATTTPSRRSSRACAATTPTARSTGSPR